MSSAAFARTSISGCQGLFLCQAHATASSEPHWCIPSCLGPVLPPPLQTTRHTDAPQGTSLATATLLTHSPACRGFGRSGLYLIRQHKAASAPWGCTFLSQGLILESSAWCPGIHTHTPGLGDTPKPSPSPDPPHLIYRGKADRMVSQFTDQ